MKLIRRYSFEAAHQLYRLPAEHPCSRLHGHHYEFEAIVESGILDHRSMIIEYSELDEIVDDAVLQRYDHRYLNEFIDQPTVEEIAADIWIRLKEADPRIVSVRVWETERSSVEYP